MNSLFINMKSLEFSKLNICIFHLPTVYYLAKEVLILDTIFVVLHILFGLGSFIGSLLLVWGFKETFQTLTAIQKSGIILTVISLFATIAVTMFSKGNVLLAILFVLLGGITCAALGKKKTA